MTYGRGVAAVALMALVALTGCKDPRLTPAQQAACDLPAGALDPGNSHLIPDERLTCAVGDVHEHYSEMYDRLHSADSAELADAVVVILKPYGNDPLTTPPQSIAAMAGVRVHDEASCSDEIVAQLREDLQIQYMRHSDAAPFFDYLATATAYLTGAAFFPKGSSWAGKKVTTSAVEEAVAAFGDAVRDAGQGMYIRASGTRLVVTEALQKCATGGPVSSRADATPQLEPYVINSVAGAVAGPSMWLNDTVGITDFMQSQSGAIWGVHDQDLNPVDLSSVNLPDTAYPIPGGALVHAGDLVDNVAAWQGVQQGVHEFTVPFNLYSPPVIGYRYLVQPLDGNDCGGTVWDLTAGEATDVVLPADLCLMAVSDHYGLIQGDSDVPQGAVDLLTGDVTDVPTVYTAEGQLAYSYDGVDWTSPVVPDHVSVGYDRVVYTVGDDVVILDSADGSELRRWSLSRVLQRQNCLLQGSMADERVLFLCNDNPGSWVTAETVVVGHRPARQGGGAEGGSI